MDASHNDIVVYRADAVVDLEAYYTAVAKGLEFISTRQASAIVCRGYVAALLTPTLMGLLARGIRHAIG